MRLSVNVECVVVVFVPSQKNTGVTKARLTGRWWEFVSRVKGTNKYLKWTPDIKGTIFTSPAGSQWGWLMCWHLNNSFSFTYRWGLAEGHRREIFLKKIALKICTFTGSQGAREPETVGNLSIPRDRAPLGSINRVLQHKMAFLEVRWFFKPGNLSLQSIFKTWLSCTL